MPRFIITIERDDSESPRARLIIGADTDRVDLVAQAIMSTLPSARIFGNRVIVPADIPEVEAKPTAPEEPEEEAGPRITRYERDWVL